MALSRSVVASAPYCIAACMPPVEMSWPRSPPRSRYASDDLPSSAIACLGANGPLVAVERGFTEPGVDLRRGDVGARRRRLGGRRAGIAGKCLQRGDVAVVAGGAGAGKIGGLGSENGEGYAQHGSQAERGGNRGGFRHADN